MQLWFLEQFQVFSSAFFATILLHRTLILADFAKPHSRSSRVFLTVDANIFKVMAFEHEHSVLCQRWKNPDERFLSLFSDFALLTGLGRESSVG